MADKAAEKKDKEKSGEKAARKQRSVKLYWLPFATWIIGAVLVTFLVFIFYGLSLSPTITAAYFVIVVLGFYILWRSRKRRKGKNKNE